ncbi:unnamed protein product, partial [Protopolystoma xenopodis]
LYFRSTLIYFSTYSLAVHNVLYLGSVEVDRLEDAAAVRRAVSQLFAIAANLPRGLTKRTDAAIKVVPGEGITIYDRTRRGFVKKTLRPSQILWCGLDPENREFNDDELKSRGIHDAK